MELWKNMRIDCAGGMLISPKRLENVLKKLKNGKGSPDQITADVLKAFPPECLEKLARSLSLMCWNMDFPEDWLCSLTVMAPKVVGATCLTKFKPIAGLCAMRKVLDYVWLKSLPPLRYESVQTAFVPKTHADAGLFLLLKAEELSREWQREIAVDHRAAFKAMKLQGVSLFSMALIAAIWSGSCMKACLGTVTSRCGADCCFGVCCRNNGVRSDRKTERGWTDGWRTENTLDEFPEDDGQKHHGGRIGCGVGGNFGVCGIDGVSGWECKTCDRTQNSSSQQMPCKMETCVDFAMAPQIAAVEHRKNYDVAGFPLELECLDDGQGTEGQNCELERELLESKKPPGMELGQWWRLWHRTGHRWIEKCNMNVLVAIRDRMLSWAGHVARMDYKEICAKALRCRGLQWWRWRQLNWKEVERDKWSGPHPQRFKIYRWEDMVAGEVSKFVGNADGLSKNGSRQHGLVAFCSKPWKLEAIFEMWKEP